MPAHRQSLLLIAVCGLALLMAACAERKSPSESEIVAHSESWGDPTSADFHGHKVKTDAVDGCESCHGTDLDGDAVTPGCTNACHDGAGGHPYNFVPESSDNFHGDIVAANGPSQCRGCHGDEYRGGWAGVSCYLCHAMGPSGHPDGWLNTNASTFHANEVYENGTADCRRCHGNDLEGGTSGLACSLCHG